MKQQRVFAFLALAVLLVTAATAQPKSPAAPKTPEPIAQVIIQTSDGPVIISGTSVRIRDYQFVIDCAQNGELFTLTDRKNGISATLDLRDDLGVYFMVVEGGTRMQLTAPWTNVLLGRQRIDKKSLTVNIGKKNIELLLSRQRPMVI